MLHFLRHCVAFLLHAKTRALIYMLTQGDTHRPQPCGDDMVTFGDVRSAIHNGHDLPPLLPDGSGDYIAAHVARCLRGGAQLPKGWHRAREARDVVAEHVLATGAPVLATSHLSVMRGAEWDAVRSVLDGEIEVYGVRVGGLAAVRLRLWMSIPVQRMVREKLHPLLSDDIERVIDLRERAALGQHGWRDMEREAFIMRRVDQSMGTHGLVRAAAYYNNAYPALRAAAQAHVVAELYDEQRHDAAHTLWSDDALSGDRERIYSREMTRGWQECVDRLLTLTREDYASMIRAHDN